MIVIHPCPDCGAPTEETDRFALDSTDGAVLHVALRCARKHHFRMPVDLLPASFVRTPGRLSDAAVSDATGPVTRSIPRAYHDSDAQLDAPATSQFRHETAAAPAAVS